ncbi:MAG: hypothetical protein OTJ98_09990 [Dehalococcoidia bacterium]|nr:hypothetical protein [Dehalococcoidia bacterium]
MTIACGGGSDSDPEQEATPAPAAGDAVIPTTVPTAVVAPEVVAPEAAEKAAEKAETVTAAETVVSAETAVAEALAATPTALVGPPPPTATPIESNVFDGYGFTLKIDQDTQFASSDFAVTGWTGPEADNSQGLATFNYKGAGIVLYWEPQTNTPQNVAASTYELQQLSKPEFDFVSINEGDLVVDGEPGSFGGFLYTDATGGNPVGGLIGAWTCPANNQSLSLTATGSDATALQIRFDRLITGFECGI